MTPIKMPLLQHSRIAKTFRQMMRRHQPAAYHVGYAEIASSGCLHWHVIVATPGFSWVISSG